MGKILSFNSLTAGYGRKAVLQNLTFGLEEGKLHALLGPNGSGKSTLLRTILKETQILSGSLELEGKDLSAYTQRELSQHLSYVPQKAILPEGFTVKDVLEMVSYSLGEVSEMALDKALDDVGILHLKERKATELSGGEVQLVLLARAILMDTRLLLLDEPTSSLDINREERFLALVENLRNQGKGILMIVHDLNVAYRHADDVIVLKEGTLYAQGKPEDTLTEKMLSEVYGSSATLHKTMEGDTVIY